MSGRALVLNASFEPLSVVTARRALVLVLSEKAVLVEGSGGEMRSVRRSFAEPSVVKLVHYVRVPHQTRVAVTRRSVFVRDGHRCQYCGAQAENIDHVVPRSRGGTHSWENVVACCRRCNTRKEDRLVEEAGFSLTRQPRAPRSRLWLLAASGEVQLEWAPYVAPVLDQAVAV
ncbi:MAG: HNH endonuclease [Acidimicrobiales bacterium]|jgi:5-methylcytosine-specific restriction endonuclease McrA